MKLFMHLKEVNSTMAKVYLYARHTGIAGTALLETTMKNAVQAMRIYRKAEYQLGILNVPSESSVKKVYGEFAPFKKVNSIAELVATVQ